MKIFNLILLFISISAISQNKKEILINENDVIIPLNEFKAKIAPPDYKYTYMTFDTDTAIVAKLVLRKEFGKLNIQEIENIKNELETISGNQINDDRVIIINYFFTEKTTNKNLAINHYPYDRKYKRFVQKNPQIAQFFMTEKGLVHKEDYVYEDKNEVIRKLLFKYPFVSNYIIIKPNGNFYRQYSEYRQDEILDIIKAKW